MKFLKDVVLRPEAELERLLVEHLDALSSHCANFDAGKTHFAAEIAVNLRVLLTDAQGANRSFLHQLGRDDMHFYDTELTIAGGQPKVHVDPAAGLAVLGVEDVNGELIANWYPTLGLAGGLPVFMRPYAEWWSRVVLSTSNATFKRQSLVRLMANQDRGSHVAPGYRSRLL